jgi:hypothetical protein
MVRLGRSWVSACANYVAEIEFLEVTGPSFYSAHRGPRPWGVRRACSRKRAWL